MQGTAADINEAFISDLDCWLHAERARLRPQSRSLEEGECDFLAKYFSPETLAVVRVLASPDLTIVEPPPQYAAFLSAGVSPPIDFARIRGLTLVDTIIIASARVTDAASWRATLFQECVHVCQFRHLGSAEFLIQYLRSWQEHSCGHDDIPLEHQASALMTRAVTQPDAPFSVELTVASTIYVSHGD